MRLNLKCGYIGTDETVFAEMLSGIYNQVSAKQISVSYEDLEDGRSRFILWALVRQEELATKPALGKWLRISARDRLNSQLRESNRHTALGLHVQEHLDVKDFLS